LEGLLDLGARTVMAIAVLSVAAGLALPGIGTQLGLPYYGAWCGIFWNRNYLGSAMALGGAILLLAGAFTWRRNRTWAILYLASYGLALWLVAVSRSATGALLALILHAAIALMAGWQRVRHRLRPIHHWIIAAVAALLGGTGIANLNVILSLFNRDTTFTGRVELWRHLWQNVVAQRPIFGHGLGTLWTDPAFQVLMRDAVGWPYPIVIADNGYIDILLQLGVVGLAALLVAIAWAAYVGIKLLLRTTGPVSMVPALAVIYMLATNISLGFFLEMESFSWIVLWGFVLGADRRMGLGPAMEAAGR
jgi:O-antigen ligase